MLRLNARRIRLLFGLVEDLNEPGGLVVRERQALMRIATAEDN